MHSYNPDYHTQDGALIAQANLARARHRSYALLGRLFREGITRQILPTLERIARLAVLLPERFNEDEAAASYYHLFGFNVFAYEAIFLGSSEDQAPAQLGGETTHGVEQFYRRVGYRTDATDLSVDHIAYEFGLLAHLAAAEAEAWEDQHSEKARQMQQHQAAFLAGHLLRWLPAVSEAIRSQKQPFFSAVAELALDLIEDHAVELASDSLLTAPEDRWLPSPPDLLSDEKTGLREVAHYLTTPALSAIYLSRDTIGVLAQSLELPRGFGSRQQLLENLLHAAVQYDAIERLLLALDEIAAHWERSYETTFVPSLHDFTQPWQEQLAATRRLLQDMARQSAGQRE